MAQSNSASSEMQRSYRDTVCQSTKKLSLEGSKSMEEEMAGSKEHLEIDLTQDSDVEDVTNSMGQEENRGDDLPDETDAVGDYPTIPRNDMQSSHCSTTANECSNEIIQDKKDDPRDNYLRRHELLYIAMKRKEGYKGFNIPVRTDDAGDEWFKKVDWTGINEEDFFFGGELDITPSDEALWEYYSEKYKNGKHKELIEIMNNPVTTYAKKRNPGIASPDSGKLAIQPEVTYAYRRCRRCYIYYGNKENIVRHEARCNLDSSSDEDEIFSVKAKCRTCERVFDKNFQFMLHELNCKSKQKLKARDEKADKIKLSHKKCKMCETFFEIGNQLEDHLKVHHKGESSKMSKMLRKIISKLDASKTGTPSPTDSE